MKNTLRSLGLIAVLSLTALAARAQSGWVFEGCWTRFPAGPCYDIYRDSAGKYWKCKACGTTTNPSPQTCGQIFPYSVGYWCS